MGKGTWDAEEVVAAEEVAVSEEVAEAEEVAAAEAARGEPPEHPRGMAHPWDRGNQRCIRSPQLLSHQPPHASPLDTRHNDCHQCPP